MGSEQLSTEVEGTHKVAELLELILCQVLARLDLLNAAVQIKVHGAGLSSLSAALGKPPWTAGSVEPPFGMGAPKLCGIWWGRRGRP